MTRGVAGFLDRVQALRREGQGFVVATVVGRRAPVSAHLGDRAIILADGRMEGFVGGACSRDIVRRQALDALRARQPRLVSIRPGPDAERSSSDEHVVVPMTCASEGAVDVYIEPMLPPRRLVIIGATPVAEALSRVGASVDYQVVRVVDPEEAQAVEPEATAAGAAVETLPRLGGLLAERPSDTAVVVASQGHYDEQALETVLASQVPYVGLVASRKRAATIRAWLEENGAPRLADLRNPAGLDLGARSAPEVALSIVAEIVQRHQAAARGDEAPVAVAAVPSPDAIDPVCGMSVAVATAKHSAVLDGTTYYFCCPHCRARFVKDPHDFLAPQP